MDPLSDQSPFASRFEEYAEAFVRFARAHRLTIDKYPKGAPMWSFCFSHPAGGQAKLDLTIGETGDIKLASLWWIDSYQEFTRSLKCVQETEIVPNVANVVGVLGRALHEVLKWKAGDWTHVVSDYGRYWGAFSKEEFEEMRPDWPKPIV